MIDSAAEIAGLFPEGIAVAVWNLTVPPPEPLPDEARAVARAVPARRREFAAGRASARLALERLGHPHVGPIPAGPDRTPVWPIGIVGSITHCAGLTAAAVGQTSEFRGIGLDAEPAMPLEPELVPVVCSRRERSWIDAQREVDSLDWPKLFFCLKEAVQKCVFLELRTLLEFSDVEVHPEPERRTFRATAATDSQPEVSSLLARLQGRFAHTPTHCVGGAWIPR
jgi:4'-phosphopantetheinyl transferase EntD